MNPTQFQWLATLPITALVAVTVVFMLFSTTLRYLLGPPLSDFGAWLTFLGSLTTVVGGVVVGKRATAKPEVIAAESLARQQETPPPPLPTEGQP